jgi:hypothetical protein
VRADKLIVSARMFHAPPMWEIAPRAAGTRFRFLTVHRLMIQFEFLCVAT